MSRRAVVLAEVVTSLEVVSKGTAIHQLRLTALVRPLLRATLIFAALLVASGAHATAQPILVLGDSLSAAYGIPREQGWVAQLEQALPTHPVINASISGETTEGGRQRLPSLLDKHGPEVVVIELGGNDGLRGFPLKRICANLREMVEMSQRAGAQVLLLGMKIPPNYGARYTQGFEQCFTDTASALDVPLVPFLLDGVATVTGMMQADGIHPTATAQRRLLENVLPTLQPLLSED